MADKGLQTIFDTIAKAKGSKDGKLDLDGIKKWFKDTAVISKDTGITEADVEAAVGKTCKDKKSIGFAEVQEFISALAKEKKLELKVIMEKLAAASPIKGVTGAAEAEVEVEAKLPKDEKEK